MVVQPPQYTDGIEDRHNLVDYIQERLGRDGWEFPPLDQTAATLETVSQSLYCGLQHSAEAFSWGQWVDFACVDSLGRDMFRLRGSGNGFTFKGDLEDAIRNMAEQLRERRLGCFIADSTVDILATLPVIETHPLTELELDERIDAGQLAHELEGIWQGTDGQAPYRLGITQGQSLSDLVVVVFDSPETVLWEPGMVKARLTETADSGTFVVRFGLEDHQEVSGTAKLSGSAIRTALQDGTDVEWLRLRPAASTADSRVLSSGTAFIVHPDGRLLTAHHVIDGATAVSVSCNGEPAVPATVTSSSVATDLAILEASGDLGTDSFIRLSPQRVPSLGDTVFTIGYPTPDLLGTDPKYTNGTVSALSRLRGDASFLQISVPIQPGNSGGALVNDDGDVIGVVVATAAAPAFIRATDSIPQNINWAVKSAFASVLFEPPPADRTPTADADTAVIERVTAATCLVRVTGPAQ